MSTSIKPEYVPVEVVSRWPSMASELWTRTFARQAIVLLPAAAVLQFMPAWSAILGFVIAPSLFIICFSVVEHVDEQQRNSGLHWLIPALRGATRLAYLSARMAAGFGLGAIVLFAISTQVELNPSVAPQFEAHAEQHGMPSVSSRSVPGTADNLIIQFTYFCSTWIAGVTTLMLLGLLVVAIYQGLFGVPLYAHEGMKGNVARAYAWQAWQINLESIEEALRRARPNSYRDPAVLTLTFICSFETVYLSFSGLVLATYIPCLGYVAYRSIFFNKHENAPARNQSVINSHFNLAT